MNQINGLTISEMITVLENIKYVYGDLQVTAKNEVGSLVSVNDSEVYEFKGKVIIDC